MPDNPTNSDIMGAIVGTLNKPGLLTLHAKLADEQKRMADEMKAMNEQTVDTVEKVTVLEKRADITQERLRIHSKLGWTLVVSVIGIITSIITYAIKTLF